MQGLFPFAEAVMSLKCAGHSQIGRNLLEPLSELQTEQGPCSHPVIHSG